jgi:hypothetical protein
MLFDVADLYYVVDMLYVDLFYAIVMFFNVVTCLTL